MVVVAVAVVFVVVTTVVLVAWADGSALILIESMAVFCAAVDRIDARVSRETQIWAMN